jgi:hypothetical protein
MSDPDTLPTIGAHATVTPPVRVRHGVTKRQAEGPNWVRTGPGLYVPADTLQSPEQRIVQAAALLRPGGAVTGWGSLRWLGGAWFEGMRADGEQYDDVQLACDHRRPWRGVTVCEEGLDPREVLVVDGVPVTDPVRSVVFLMRYATSLRVAVRAFDMAAYNDLVSYDEVSAYVGCHHAWTGIPLARKALEHCDENAWSPTEVDMRLLWELGAGLPRPLTNMPIFTLGGRHIGTPDLLDPVSGVLGEYDGGLHLAGARRARDIRREAVFREHGLEPVTMVAEDRIDNRAFLDRLQAAYRRARRRLTSDRSWTVVPPPWWVATHTVQQRRSLTADQRRRFLAIRRTVA